MDRKKALKLEYKQMKHPMGIFIIYSKSDKKCLLQVTNDLRGTINGAWFKLDMNGFPNRELQKEWTALGKDNFSIEVLEELEYDKDESKTDYSEELEVLRYVWMEKYEKEGYTFYKR